jgi:hypothetical protein
MPCHVAPVGRAHAQCQAARFKLSFKPIQNIETVQIKFKFLQTLAGSKGTFPRSNNLK